MGQAPRELTPESSLAHRFGAYLRTAREARGLSQVSLGQLVYFSGATIGRVEKAERGATRALAERCDVVLGQDGRLLALWEAMGLATGAAGGLLPSVSSAAGAGVVASCRRLRSWHVVCHRTCGLTRVVPERAYARGPACGPAVPSVFPEARRHSNTDMDRQPQAEVPEHSAGDGRVMPRTHRTVPPDWSHVLTTSAGRCPCLHASRWRFAQHAGRCGDGVRQLSALHRCACHIRAGPRSSPMCGKYGREGVVVVPGAWWAVERHWGGLALSWTFASLVGEVHWAHHGRAVLGGATGAAVWLDDPPRPAGGGLVVRGHRRPRGERLQSADLPGGRGGTARTPGPGRHVSVGRGTVVLAQRIPTLRRRPRAPRVQNPARSH
jgi:hypothetical protein